MLHIRDADRDAIRVLKFYQPKYGGVVHCCGEGWDIISEYLKLGLYIGIGGTLLNPARNERLKPAVAKIPLERILIETDSPYLSPVPMRGKRNDSRNIPYILGKLAELRGISLSDAERITCQNGKALFGLV